MNIIKPMNIEEIYKEYCLKIAPLHMHQRSIKKIIDEEIKNLIEYANSIKDNKFASELPASVDNFYFYGARDGCAKLLAYKSSSIDEKIKMTVLHKNKQYQWILAEAYEIYEDFLQNIYAYIGFNNNELWPLSDFGTVTLKELKDKNFEYFQKQAQNKKDIPHSILSKLRDILPNYTDIEIKNKLNKNIKLIIILIEKFRHIIVHRTGIIKDKKSFIESIIQKTGLLNNGKYDKDLYDYISGFFGKDEYENVIILLERQVMTELQIRVEIEPLNILINILSASVYAICEDVNKEIQRK
jgi:hypothetical protein